MAEQPDIATKAPESDVEEKTVFSAEDQAQSGPSMGEHCTTDRPTPAGQQPTGEMTKIADVDCYVAKPADYPHSPSKLLIMLTGGTGVKSTNNQLQADRFASEGFLVVMPDQFGGDAAPNTVTSPTADQFPSFLENVKMRVAETAKSFVIDMWLARQTPEKVLPILHKVVDGAKEVFADAVANGGGIYGVGYCFGARYILLLGGGNHDVPGAEEKPQDEEQGRKAVKDPLIKAGTVAHGAQITKEDIESVKVPMSLICVENDPLFPEEVLDAGVKALEQNKVEHEVKVYSAVPHGFAVLGDYEEAKIKESQQQAFGQMLGWLQAH